MIGWHHWFCSSLNFKWLTYTYKFSCQSLSFLNWCDQKVWLHEFYVTGCFPLEAVKVDRCVGVWWRSGSGRTNSRPYAAHNSCNWLRFLSWLFISRSTRLRCVWLVRGTVADQLSAVAVTWGGFEQRSRWSLCRDLVRVLHSLLSAIHVLCLVTIHVLCLVSVGVLLNIERGQVQLYFIVT